MSNCQTSENLLGETVMSFEYKAWLRILLDQTHTGFIEKAVKRNHKKKKTKQTNEPKEDQVTRARIALLKTKPLVAQAWT